MVIGRRDGVVGCYCPYPRGCGMVVVFLSSSARELCLVPNKHSSSIFTLKLFASEHFYRLSYPSAHLNIER